MAKDLHATHLYEKMTAVSVKWIIIFATNREAAATIQKLAADKISSNRSLFFGGEIMVCGMGLEAAHHSASEAPTVGYRWLNIGLAGSLDPRLSVGSMRSIGRVGLLRSDESGRYAASEDLLPLEPNGATLYSSSNPVYSVPEVKVHDALVDMEGYAIASVAQRRGVPLILRKVVSDHCSNSSHADILSNIDRLSHHMAEEVASNLRY